MGLLKKLFSAGASTFMESAGELADRFIETPDERSRFKLELENLLQRRDSEIEQTARVELQTRERIIVAELNSGDSYTRRARPSLVYFGMLVIFINYVLFPKLALLPLNVPKEAFAPVDLPDLFWWAWGGAVGIWSIGRTVERRGSNQEMVKMINDWPGKSVSPISDL